MSLHSETKAPEVVKWLLDTRSLWQVSKKASPRDETQELRTVASRALALLSPEEQASVLKYYHVRDAKMSLASHLLKHFVITKYCSVSWTSSKISRDTNGKPCFKPHSPSSSHMPFDFNVSHQAGIVSLIAAIGFLADVGTDVVCVNEREKQDKAHIEKEGFEDWVDMHGDVFAKSELDHMKFSSVGEGGKGIDEKLRRFYAMWCLRETYVKMTGEALLAPWLKELEIGGVGGPVAGMGQDESSLEEGDTEKDFEIIFKKKKVENVRMELTALGNHYMVGGAIRTDDADMFNAPTQKWEELDIETILAYAESH